MGSRGLVLGLVIGMWGFTALLLSGLYKRPDAIAGFLGLEILSGVIGGCVDG